MSLKDSSIIMELRGSNIMATPLPLDAISSRLTSRKNMDVMINSSSFIFDVYCFLGIRY